jgi:hypothetical protein
MLTREILAKEAPDLLASILAEGKSVGLDEGKKVGHADGVKAERERIAAIEDLGLVGCDDLVKAAKFEQPTDAPTLAVAAIKAGKQAGAEILAAREREGLAAAGVRQSSPTNSTEEAELAAVKTIAEHANRRRGGSR